LKTILIYYWIQFLAGLRSQTIISNLGGIFLKCWLYSFKATIVLKSFKLHSQMVVGLKHFWIRTRLIMIQSLLKKTKNNSTFPWFQVEWNLLRVLKKYHTIVLETFNLFIYAMTKKYQKKPIAVQFHNTVELPYFKLPCSK